MQEPHNPRMQPYTSPGVPLNGCLYTIILIALMCMTVKGCKMVNMKYKEQKVQHEIKMDSLNRVQKNTINYKGR